MRFNLIKYFTLEKIVDAHNLPLTKEEVEAIKSICTDDLLDIADIEVIGKLIKARLTADYTLHDEIGNLKAFLDERPKITAIKFMADEAGHQYQVKNQIVVQNILHFLNRDLKEYLDSNNIPREKRKIKGTLPSLQKYNRRLAAQVIEYFRDNTSLTRERIIVIVFNLFSEMGNPLVERTGELCNPTINLYDSIIRTTRKP